MRWILLFILMGFASPVTAARQTVASMESQYQRATLIVKGEVVDRRAFQADVPMKAVSWDQQGNPIESISRVDTVLTETTIAVSEVLKGDPDTATATFVVMGGRVDGMGLSTSISFAVQTGAVYYFFLQWDELSQKWWPVSGGQGVYRVIQEDDTSYVQKANEMRVLARSDDPGDVDRGSLPNRLLESEFRKILIGFSTLDVETTPPGAR